MERDLLDSALRPALWGGAAIGGGLAALGARSAAAGFLAGAAWNLLSFLLLRAITRAWAREEGRRALWLLLGKLFILYPVGVALACSQRLSLIGLLAGFTWVFVPLIICAVWSATRPAGRPLAGARRV